MEIIGIIATLFIVLAFLMNGELKIRSLDLIGAILFVIYGITIKSISTIALNLILIFIQLGKIYNIFINKENEK